MRANWGKTISLQPEICGKNKFATPAKKIISPIFVENNFLVNIFIANNK